MQDSFSLNLPLIVDAHEDLAYNATSHERDLLKPVHERRAIEGSNKDRGGATTSFPELKKGNVRIVFGTIWVNPCKSQFTTKPCYSNAEEAYAQARSQIQYYKNLEHSGIISIITNRVKLDEVTNSDKIGIIMLMEGADPIRTPEEAKEWYDEGLRIVGPAWGATRYAGGTRAPGPLTKEGRELMKEMDRVGLMLDCSHLAEESFFESLDLFKGNVIVSHSNSRTYCPTDRQLSDNMIRAVTSRGAVIGTVLYNSFLDVSWTKGKPKDEITLSHVVRNIVHVSDVSGSKDNLGIGSDFDGGFGFESIPSEIDTVADLYKVGDALRSQANFSEQEARNVLGGNFLRILRKALPE